MSIYRFLRCIDKVAYELDFPSDFVLMHSVFYVSLLKKCVGDPISIVPLKSVGIKESISYEEVPIKILNCQIQKLRITKLHSESSLEESIS